MKFQAFCSNVKDGFVKNSPIICLVSGGIVMVGAIVSTVIATKKAVEDVDQTKDTLATIEEAASDGYSDEYTEDDHKKDLMITYGRLGVTMVKRYLPTVLFFSVGMVLICKGHNILVNRGAAAIAALKATDAMFNKYRSRVVEKYGEDVDYELRYGIKAEEMVESNGDNEENAIKKVYKQDSPTDDMDEYYFGSNSILFTGDEYSDKVAIKTAFRTVNENANIRRHMFINDLLDELYLKRTDEGRFKGYLNVIDPVEKYVDFIPFDKQLPDGSYERGYIITFANAEVIVDSITDIC